MSHFPRFCKSVITTYYDWNEIPCFLSIASAKYSSYLYNYYLFLIRNTETARGYTKMASWGSDYLYHTKTRISPGRLKQSDKSSDIRSSAQNIIGVLRIWEIYGQTTYTWHFMGHLPIVLKSLITICFDWNGIPCLWQLHMQNTLVKSLQVWCVLN